MDDKLSTALRSLPRERAGAGFTNRVLRRLEEPRRGPAWSGAARRGPARWPLLAAAAALMLAVALGGREWWHFHQRQQATARLLTLEQERQALVAELGELRRQMAGARPVVYLGGSNDLDLVLDLAQARRAGVRPEDLRQGLLRAYQQALPAAALPPVPPGRAQVSASWSPGGRTPGRPLEAPVYAVPGRGPAAAGVVAVRPDERRTRTIY